MSRGILFALAVVTTATMLALPATASAFERYASPTGGGAPATCSSAAPCSIADALSNTYLLNGDDVILTPGTYTVPFEITITKAIDVYGIGAASATVVESNGVANGFLINNAGAKLSNFVLHHNSGTTAGVRLVAGDLERMIVRSSTGEGCELYAGFIRDSVCATDASSHSGLAVNVGGSSIYTLSLRNVTAIGNGAANSHGIFVYADGAASVTLVGKSVIARGNSNDIWAASIDTAVINVTLSYSNFEDVGLGGSSTRTVTDPTTNSNQTAAPLFVNAAGGDYRQAAGSPTIDTGTHDAFSGLIDFEGQTRPNGAANDIGADEYHAPAAPGGPSGPGSNPEADTTAPVGKIVKGPRRKTKSRKATFKFSSNEAGSTFLCKLDRGSYKPCKSPLRARVKPGRHTLRFVAVDVFGNKDATPAIWRWRVLRGRAGGA